MNSEQGDGIDFSLRHSTDRVRVEGSVYYYNLHNFVYTAFTGATDPGSNLPIVNYAQANSRFVGTEASVEAKVVSTLWLNGKVDYVRAELTELNKPLPRIPPLRGTLGLDWRYKAFSLRPEMTLVNRQAPSGALELALPKNQKSRDDEIHKRLAKYDTALERVVPKKEFWV